MSSSSYVTRVTKWGELEEGRKREALMTMCEQIVDKVGDGSATDMSSQEVRNLCGQVFKNFLPAGNWKGNVPNGVLRDLSEAIHKANAGSKKDTPFITLRDLSGYDEACKDWFEGNPSQSSSTVRGGLKVSFLFSK